MKFRVRETSRNGIRATQTAVDSVHIAPIVGAVRLFVLSIGNVCSTQILFHFIDKDVSLSRSDESNRIISIWYTMNHNHVTPKKVLLYSRPIKCTNHEHYIETRQNVSQQENHFLQTCTVCAFICYLFGE